VDVAFQHFTTAWTLVGWALIIFQLSLVLLAMIDYVMWGAAIFWLAAGVGLQGRFGGDCASSFLGVVVVVGVWGRRDEVASSCDAT
jgi:hypothetical protein